MITTRQMRQEDLAEVAGIELETLSPWSFVSLEQELHVQQGRQLVAVSPDLRILGWCACRQVWPEAELLKIAVTTGGRNNGVGTTLLRRLIRELQGQAYRSLFLEVRAKNRPAVNFYERHGFFQVGVRPNYYSDPADDALLMRSNLGLD